MKLPSQQEIYAIHKQQTKGQNANLVLDLVWTHSLIVKEISLLIVDNLKKLGHDVVNTDLIIAGSLLHDIGAYKCLVDYPKRNGPPYIQHGIIGARIIKGLGFEEILARFAACHTGVGITREDIQRQHLPLPKQDLIPITAEEEIVAFADNFHGKEPAFCTFEEARKEFTKFNPINGAVMDVWRRKYTEPDLAEIQEKYKSWHIEFLQKLKHI